MDNNLGFDCSSQSAAASGATLKHCPWLQNHIDSEQRKKWFFKTGYQQDKQYSYMIDRSPYPILLHTNTNMNCPLYT